MHSAAPPSFSEIHEIVGDADPSGARHVQQRWGARSAPSGENPAPRSGTPESALVPIQPHGQATGEHEGSHSWVSHRGQPDGMRRRQFLGLRERER